MGTLGARIVQVPNSFCQNNKTNFIMAANDEDKTEVDFD